ncbi:unnamed protein product [Mucor hiemalis]
MLYQQLFFTNLFPLHQELKSYIRNQVEECSDFYHDQFTLEEVHEFRKKTFRDESIDAKHNFDFTNTDTMAPQLYIDRVGTLLEEALYDALNNSVTVGQYRPKDWNFFWNGNLQQLEKLRLHAYQQWRRACQSNSTVEDIAEKWKTYDLQKNNLKKQIKKEKRRHFKKFCHDVENLPANEVYPILKQLKKKHTTTTNFSHVDGPETAANTTADHLRSVYGGNQTDFSGWRASRSPLYKKVSTPHFFTARAIKKCLFSMGSRKAPGKDHITKEMLTAIWYPLCNFLSDFFTLCYTWAWTPSNFRSALVVPIHKKGDHTLASNYRPISLTTTMRKIYERCLQHELLATMPALDVVQGGFRASRGSVDQTFNLLALQQQFKHLYDTDASLCMLDQNAAYDSLSRNRIFQLLKPHLPAPLFYTLRNLFDMVTSEVVIKNFVSAPIFPKNGVLQGSILSPFLYAVFINELPAFLRTVPTHFPLSVDVATYPSSYISYIGFVNDIQRCYSLALYFSPLQFFSFFSQKLYFFAHLFFIIIIFINQQYCTIKSSVYVA